MEEIICYKLSDGTILENKESAIKRQKELDNKQIIYNTQNVPLNFGIGDIVYISCRDKVRQCKVKDISENISEYDFERDEIYTMIDLEDINNKEEGIFNYWTSENKRDLNKSIKLSVKDLCNFDLNI